MYHVDTIYFIGVILNSEIFRLLEAELEATHAGLATELGMSEISVKRMATGAQVITEQTARQITALILIEREGLKKKYQKLLAEYHDDTL